MKALFVRFEAEKGRVEAEEWLATARIRPEELEDETRLFPLVALARALDAYVEKLSLDGLRASGPGFIARDNLGLWSKLLRGAVTPEAAFLRLDGSESEYGRTTLWETLESRPGLWRGRVRIAHDPRLEQSEHLAELRAVELSMVPCLFGHPRAEVQRAGSLTLQEYTVSWTLPIPASRTMGLGGVVGAVLGAVPVAFVGHGYALASVVALAALGIGAGHVFASDRRGKVESRAQTLRVAALERSLVLKELRETGAAGDLVGTVVAGQYRLGKSMGSGATGVIYEAVRLADDLPVAVKLLRAAAAHDTVASDRLRREAEALGLAWHPNVVEALDHGHLPDGSSYLVMELLRGRSLSERLTERGGRISEDELLRIALPLAEALSAVHAAGVIHRDLKPSNLFLVREDDESETVKILDFGIARVEWEEMRITNLGAPMGTPGYMAPEQEAGGEADARADLYSLGATFYECLVGEPPVADQTGHFPAIDSSDGAAVSGVRKSASPVLPGWQAILEKCLAKSPDDRFPDARALVRELRALRARSPSPSQSGESVEPGRAT
jgi:hypothetical protein